MVARVTFPPGPGLAVIFGYREEHLRRLETSLRVRLIARGNEVTIKGSRGPVQAAVRVLQSLRESREPLSPELARGFLVGTNPATGTETGAGDSLAIRTPRRVIAPRGRRQAGYIKAMRSCDMIFSVGPAGTGKTYLAVGCALASFMAQKVERIILVRPVVEAGERLGFLPGGVEEKVNPYMRPLYDSLKEMLDFASLKRLVEQETIEIAPLAYMRGRTLNRAFIILDEAQNTTVEQMKMFLTRLGVGSRAVMTGDITQIDLPVGVTSGLVHAVDILEGVKGVGVARFLPADVVRHEMVQRVLNAFDRNTRRGKRRGGPSGR